MVLRSRITRLRSRSGYSHARLFGRGCEVSEEAKAFGDYQTKPSRMLSASAKPRPVERPIATRPAAALAHAGPRVVTIQARSQPQTCVTSPPSGHPNATGSGRRVSVPKSPDEGLARILPASASICPADRNGRSSVEAQVRWHCHRSTASSIRGQKVPLQRLIQHVGSTSVAALVPPPVN